MNKPYQYLISEAAQIIINHPSKDARSFASSVIEYFARNEETFDRESQEKPAKRIRCFYQPKDENGGIWEAYEDGEIIYFSGADSDEGVLSTYTLKELESALQVEEYEAWEVDEPLPSDYPSEEESWDNFAKFIMGCAK